jgi:hypothetical protein
MSAVIQQFIASIESCNLDRAKQLYENHGVEIETNDVYKSGELFVLVCVEGNLEGAKWLYGLDDVAYTCALRAFKVSLLNGKINIGKWIGKTMGECINNSDIIFVFRQACCHCQQDTIDYLMQNYVDIDYTYQTGSLIEHCIMMKYDRVIQFMIQTYPQFINFGDDLLLITIQYCSEEVLKTILKTHNMNKSLLMCGSIFSDFCQKPEMKQILDKEINWLNKMYPLWLASNESPCKSNLFYRIPEDVSRYIISQYLS